MTEIWKDAVGHDGYQVSNLGNVRGVDRMARCKGGFRLVKGKIIAPQKVKSTGYTQVDLNSRRISVHRLVAMTWCSGYFEGAVVDHINGVRDDNRTENLEWVTSSVNQRRSYQNGRVPHTRGKFSSAHGTSKPVISVRICDGSVSYWPSAMDAVRAGFDSSSISRCCAGKYKSHKGHTWRFGDEVAA
jgi:hypothetical protein